MGLFKNFWRKLTHTKALDQSSGKLETAFFEPIYRLAYITGLSTTDKGGSYLLYSLAAKLMIFLLMSGEVWFAFEETTSLDEFAASINVTLIQFIAVIRYNNMMTHKKFYKKLATSMESPNFDISTENRKKYVDYWVQTNKKYFNLVCALGNCTLIAWFTFPLLDDVEYNLIVGIRMPFYYKTTVMYPVAYILVIIAFVYIAHFVMVTDLIMQTHLIHLLCQYDVLADCFENLYNDCNIGYEGLSENDIIYNKSFANKYTERLGKLVQQHRLILSHTMNLRKTLSAPMLGQLAASATLICFLGYQATTTLAESAAKFVMSLFFLGYNLFGLYIICKWCEEITNRSLKIGEAVYCSGWECGVTRLPGVRSTLLFLIARANKPLYITAGGMYNLSLDSYATLVKTSYSALTVLLRFRHD